jgi:hypothetical protein
VERGEVVVVQGNDLVVKMEGGTIRHVANVPESARINVDGRELGIHDLKPGMKLQRTITTKTIPQTITTVKTVTGKVWHIFPPGSVIPKSGVKLAILMQICPKNEHLPRRFMQQLIEVHKSSFSLPTVLAFELDARFSLPSWQ